MSAASHESPTVDGSPEAVSGDVPTATQDEFSPADSLINAVREVVLKLLTVPMTDSQVAASLNVSVSQARAWLQRLVKEGTRNTRNKPVRSLCVLRLRCLLTLTTRRRCDAWARGGAEPLTSVLNVYEIERKSSPCPVVILAGEAERTKDYAVTAASRASGSVTAPGVASAASVAVSRYVWGSMPTSFADSHSV